MSRVKRFTHAVLSGYLAQAANVLIAFVSIPLALHYLDPAEFSVWALTAQITGYLAVIDMGMRFSVARILMDEKDDRNTGAYGSTIKAGLSVGAIQGAIVLIAGVALVPMLAKWFRIEDELSTAFFWLMGAQLLITCLSFLLRIFSQLLTAWQRVDIINYSLVAQALVWLLGLTLGFRLGFGIYSVLWSSLASWLCATIVCGASSRWLRLWPATGQWGAMSRKKTAALFSYSTDLFLITLGTQLVLYSQAILVGRLISLEVLGTWVVLTKVFNVLGQMFFQTISNSMPAFGEMQARGESERLWDRYRILFVIVSVAATTAILTFAVCNSPFVHWWTRGRMTWPRINDILLAGWLIILVQQCCHNSLLVSLKRARRLGYVYLLEGIVFVAAAIYALPRWGFTGMLWCSLLGTVAFTYFFGLREIREILPKEVRFWRWHMPMLRTFLMLAPVAFGAAWLLHDLPTWAQFLIPGIILPILGLSIAVRFAIPAETIADICTKLPPPLRRPAQLFCRSQIIVARS